MKHILFEASKTFARTIRDWHRRAPWRTWICVLAFSVSFGYALVYRITPSVDARKFHEIAVHLVQDQTFCFECTVPLAEDTAIRDIGPGYQFFLALIYTLFGIHPWVVWLVQALMHAVVVGWLWRLMDLLLQGASEKPWMRIVPLALYAIHPDVVQSNAMLMADGLFTFIFVGAVLVFLPYLLKIQAQNGKRAVLLGAMMGILTMVRPTGLPLFLVMLMVLAGKRAWKGLVLAACFFVAVQVPWGIRNALTYDHFIYNSVVGGLDIWVGLYPKGPGEFNLDALPEITERIRGLAPDELDRVALAEAKTIIREQPLFAIGRTTSKFFKLFALTKTSGFWFHYRGAWDQWATVVLSIAFNLVLLGCAGAAVVYVCVKKYFKNPVFWIALVSIGVLAVAPTISVVVNRYRLPMLPFMTILAAYWFAVASTKRERLMTLAGSFSFLLLCTGMDLWGSWGKVMGRLEGFNS